MAQLKPEDLEGIDIDLKGKTKLSILQLFIQEAEKAKNECENKQWSYENSRGEKVLVRESVNTLLVNVNKYASIGDLVMQALPAPGALVWGGLKVLLQVSKIKSSIATFLCLLCPSESYRCLSRILS